jgi:hypothetical protein
MQVDERAGTEKLARVGAALADLRGAMSAEEAAHADAIARAAPSRRASARNLAHYLALRRRDLGTLQGRLAELGLSSLGRSEAHAAATVEAVKRAVALMRGMPEPVAAAPVGIRDGAAVLAARATELLGAPRARRSTRIMVTLPSDAADEPELVQEMVAAGMDCARINTAHDDERAWTRMAAHVRGCLVHVDLAGPKLRTGAIAAAGDAKPRIVLRRGDHLRVTADQVRVGESISFDDGLDRRRRRGGHAARARRGDHPRPREGLAPACRQGDQPAGLHARRAGARPADSPRCRSHPAARTSSASRSHSRRPTSATCAAG